MAAQIIPFAFEDHEIRTLLIENQPWFCAADICHTLGYSNGRDALSKHCREAGVAKRDIRSSGQTRCLTFIDEGNLYRLIIKSRKKAAQRFESWVCDEVLPAIRQNGHYADSQGKMNTLVGQTIGTDGFRCLGSVLDGKVRHLPASARTGAKNHIWSQVHKAFSVVSAQDIPADQMEAARNFIGSYALEGEYLPRQDSAITEERVTFLMLHNKKAKEQYYRLSGLSRQLARLSEELQRVSNEVEQTKKKLHDPVIEPAFFFAVRDLKH